METTINITGQAQGNNILKAAIEASGISAKPAGFGNYAVTFPTKLKAVQALHKAHRSLEAEGENCQWRNYTLIYDSSYAAIQ